MKSWKTYLFDIRQTCHGCPSQWECFTACGRPVYVRYRWGTLTVSVGQVGGNIDDAVMGAEILAVEIGGEFDGFIDWDTVIKYLDAMTPLPDTDEFIANIVKHELAG